MSKQPEFLILKPVVGWLPESWWEKVLGSVVLNPHAPTNNRTPSRPPLKENDLVESEFSDFILSKEDVGSASFELDVKGLGRFKWQKSSGNNLELKGKLIYVKKLTDCLDFWKLMMTDRAFAQKVTDWVNEKRWGRAKYEVCWVVGLLICQDVAIATSQEQEKQWKSRGEIPLGIIPQAAAMAHGLAIPIGGVGNMSAQGQSETAGYSYYAVQGKDKYIFALELSVISSRKGVPELTDKAPHTGKKMKLGDSDEEGEGLEPEDLVPREGFEEDDWQNLLQDNGS